MPTAACAQRLLLATDPDLVTLVLRTLYRAISGCLFQKSSRIGWQWGRVLAVKAHGIFLAQDRMTADPDGFATAIVAACERFDAGREADTEVACWVSPTVRRPSARSR